jgi:hypothetical protein
LQTVGAVKVDQLSDVDVADAVAVGEAEGFFVIQVRGPRG